MIFLYIIYPNIEFILLLTGSTPSYANYFSRDTNYCNNFTTVLCLCKLYYKKKQLINVKNAILEKLKKETKEIIDKYKKEKDNLSNIKSEFKIIKNSNKINKIYYENLFSKIEEEEKEYKNIRYSTSIANDKLSKRKEMIKQLEDNNITKKANLFKFYNDKTLELKINCIYFDRTIDASEEFSSSYEFYKF